MAALPYPAGSDDSGSLLSTRLTYVSSMAHLLQYSDALKTTKLYRTTIGDAVVSTVLIQDGAYRAYETAVIKCGVVSDARVTTRKADAGREHDYACAFLRGWETDAQSVRHGFWTAQVANCEEQSGGFQ